MCAFMEIASCIFWVFEFAKIGNKFKLYWFLSCITIILHYFKIYVLLCFKNIFVVSISYLLIKF